MKDHAKMQNRLKATVQEAILKTGQIEGTDDIALTNTDVVEALLEVTGLYGSMQTFETYTPRDVAFKHANTLQRHIDRFRKMREAGKLPFNFVPRSQIN